MWNILLYNLFSVSVVSCGGVDWRAGVPCGGLLTTGDGGPLRHRCRPGIRFLINTSLVISASMAASQVLFGFCTLADMYKILTAELYFVLSQCHMRNDHPVSSLVKNRPTGFCISTAQLFNCELL